MGIVRKVMSLMSILILAIVGMVVMSFYLSQNVVNHITSLKTHDIMISEAARKAYTGYLEMDDQANMWMGISGSQNQSLINATYQQVMTAENQLHSSLTTLDTLFTTPSNQALLKQIQQNLQGYEGYFTQAVQANKANNRKLAEQLMYVSNSQVSNALSREMSQIQTIGTSHLDTNATASINISRQQQSTTVIAGIILVLLSIGFIILIYILIRPIPEIVRQVQKMAAGDLTVEDLKVKSKDEIGQLVQSFNGMVKNLRTMIGNIGLSAEQVASVSEQLTASAEETSQATESIAHTIQEVAAGSETQAQRSDVAANAMKEMAEGVQHIADNAQNVSTSAQNSFQAAAEGYQSLQSVEEQMSQIHHTSSNLTQSVQRLGEHSAHIGSIVDAITEIAAQTNLLALNAAIEAARAGDAGRGFAVVAEEVRKLAEQSSQSASEIADVIHTIQSETQRTVQESTVVSKAVQEGLSKVSEAGGSFTKIRSSIEEVSSQIQEVSAAVQQLSASSEEITGSVRHIAEIATSASAGTQNVSAAAEEQLASMEEIAASATSLSKMGEELKNLIGQFKLQ